MAAVASTAGKISPLFADKAEIYPAVAGVDLAAGELVYFNSGGRLVKTNAGTAGTAKCAGVALRTVKAGQGVDVLARGHCAGFTVASLAYGAKLYAQDTAGALGDAAGEVSLVVASVVPMSERGAPKVAFFACNWLAL